MCNSNDNIFSCPSSVLLKESFIRGSDYKPFIQLEHTLGELKKLTHPQTVKYFKLRNKEGNSDFIFSDVKIDNKNIIFQYLSDPTYAGKPEHDNPEEVSTDGEQWKKTNAYTIDIKFKQWWTFFTPEEMNSGEPRLQSLRDMIAIADVQVHCSCPSFHWMGIKYELGKEEKSALNPTNIANSVWSDRNKKNYGVGGSSKICKHLMGVIPNVAFVAPKIIHDFKLRVLEWLEAGYVFDGRQGFIK